MAVIMKGKPVADALDERTKEASAALRERGIRPTLAILRIGERQDDLAYERGAVKRCAADGIEVRNVVLPETVTQDALMSAIRDLNRDETVHGVLLLRPLPKVLDERKACAALDPAKDVDGISAGSMAAVYSGAGTGFAPCTAQAAVELLRFYDITMQGRRAAVVGRSLVIGRPAALLLMQENATVTVCHSRTENLPAVLREADIVIAALGKEEFLGPDCFREGQAVVDVGIHWNEALGKLAGDVQYDKVSGIVSAISPVPGGVGSVTTAVLARHTVEAAERQSGSD